jgi:hypothetical protein
VGGYLHLKDENWSIAEKVMLGSDEAGADQEGASRTTITLSLVDDRCS